MEDFQPDFITSINSLLLLTDYQSNLIRSIGSGDRTEIINSAVACARAASLLNVPVIMTSMNEKENGIFPEELTEIFPGKNVIERPENTYDVFKDERIRKAIRRTGRDKLVVSGLWTSRTFIETALTGRAEGYDVFGLIDACGDVSDEMHNEGVHRMLKGGITPITWMSLTSEWMNGWIDPSGNELSEEVYGKYNAMLTYLSKH